jgi:hypothetical protein
MRLRKAFMPTLFRRPNRSVFDNLRSVFVHIPKTAGTSIRHKLASFPDTNPRRYVRLKTHSRAFEYRIALGEKRWKEYFSFAFVRNPFDLMVSSYFWWLEKAHDHRRTKRGQREVRAMEDFSAFTRSRLGREFINEFKGDIFDWISQDGEIIVDFVGRVESLQDDWHTVCRRLGLAVSDLPRANRTTRGDYRQYYDDEAVELVAKRFRRTIDLFGYEF